MTDNNEYTREYAPEELVPEIQLGLVDGIGSLLSTRLVEWFGTARGVLDASEFDLQQVNGIGPKVARAIVAARDCRQADAMIERCRKEGITLLAISDRRYPARLRTIHDPPTLLYVRGGILPSDAFAMAVVGTRGATYYGRRQTTAIVTGLVNAGMTIVSGLARGIDGMAHDAALNSGGRTIAVLGSGLDNVYPPEHGALAQRVAAHGAVISEFPLDAMGAKGNFPRRNRIVSGMSLGVLVVESPLRSGSLITARLAMEQDRDVFAVPGPVDSENSKGCHRLIRDGAMLVENAGDIIGTLAPLMTPVKLPERETKISVPREVNLNERESFVLGLVEATPIPIDTIIAASGLATHQVITVLSVLEMRQLVVRVGGNMVRRV